MDLGPRASGLELPKPQWTGEGASTTSQEPTHAPVSPFLAPYWWVPGDRGSKTGESEPSICETMRERGEGEAAMTQGARPLLLCLGLLT